ncbi:hypothetical protein VCRA2119O147_890014 [Vibrio crassostreae]|uniref:Uncharacterized protein n=1 Tax=Vibrio crassostreae TaxID=246167 RepID=A0ABP1X4J8_9VIBR|nr:hypothetical protein EDB56_106189 [Vibrio crassostreae]ROO55060.1 hypothetical protein EDB58_107190 [Vibrio crassostreae]ROO69169.1 hypothetical protein EDB57_2836 [Vibrio crassostreae]ROO70709.1 hypothetical protein EDB53_2828 [Vibrio crassostreae]ROP21563.1 hypothetical protein EDB33_10559 [Vibrio crassostreae]
MLRNRLSYLFTFDIQEKQGIDKIDAELDHLVKKESGIFG